MKQFKQIGKGTFSTVYQKNSNTVIIKSSDKAKECFSFGWGNDSTMMPNIKRLDDFISGDKSLYEMKLYPKCTAPKKQLNKLSYKRYSMLRKINIYTKNIHDGYDNLYKAFKDIKDNYLRDTLISAIDGLSNYGSDIKFEISPRNISFTKEGRLILLDCFFFDGDLQKIRSSK